MEEEILAAERKLRRAVLVADVDALDALLADDVLYVGPDGSTLDKAADLDAYRSGSLKIVRYEPVGEPRLQRITDETFLLSTIVCLSAEFGKTPHEGTYRYCRLYVRRNDHWQIVFAQAASLLS